MTLRDLGYTSIIKDQVKDYTRDDFIPGRVIRQYRERYIVSTGEREYDAEITGKLRYSVSSASELPAVGDWVLMIIYDDMAIINHVLPRKSVLERQAVGKFGEKQVISANIDVAFIMQSIDNNFNINRFERYLSICYSSDIEPVLVISKTDLSTGDKKEAAVRLLEKRGIAVRTVLLSNKTGEGTDSILELLQKGKTYCVIGSSGVGKSSLINNLLGDQLLKTGSVSSSTKKGKHITTTRELFILENGAVIIDTPGMRELGITDNPEGVSTTFGIIEELSMKCRFSDCSHTNEEGCAILEAVNNGIIEPEMHENYLRMLREQEYFSQSVAVKRKKDKDFGKMCKQIMKEKKKEWD